MEISMMLTVLMTPASISDTTTLSNAHFRTDVSNQPFDAHDGSIQQFEDGGPYYYHAMGYGLCREDGRGTGTGCGQYANNTVNVYASDRMASGSWQLRHSFTPSLSGWPNCTYYRSHVLKSPQTGNYVLWLNAQAGRNNKCTICPPGSQAKCFVAGTSSSPDGPFSYQGLVENMRYLEEGGVGDFDLFQDDDENRTSYAIYKRSGAAPGASAHRMTLQRLRPDLLAGDASSDASSGIIGAPFVEAPAMFKRNGTYYALFGKCCAFCAHGTGIGVYTAVNPLGPWIAHENIGCDSNVSLPSGCGCGQEMPATYNLTCPYRVPATTFAQQNTVIVTGGGDFIWTGDRWQSACSKTVASQGLPPTRLPSSMDCVKAFDQQYWSVLKWGTEAPPLPGHVSFENEITFHY